MLDKLLFTPGPLTTSGTVKRAMTRDLGSRDKTFIEVVKSIRTDLVTLAGGTAETHTTVIVQGSGTFAVEATIGTALPKNGKLAVLINGAYGRRIADMAKVLGIECLRIEIPEAEAITVDAVQAALLDSSVTHIAMVHCETTTGIVNPIDAVGKAVHAKGKRFIVDAMSSFGALPVDMRASHIDYLVSSANKCIEGAPGFAFVVASLDALRGCEGQARSVALDIHAQWRELERSGQFRFTPPTHVLLAFHRALEELHAEGGPAARAERYASNQRTLIAGMKKLGYETFLKPEQLSPIITSFRYPSAGFDFEGFYKALAAQGFAIYPGKVSNADCFRIGSIGRLIPEDVEALLAAIAKEKPAAPKQVRALKAVLFDKETDAPLGLKSGIVHGNDRVTRCYSAAAKAGVWPLSACVRVCATAEDVQEAKNAGMWSVGPEGAHVAINGLAELPAALGAIDRFAARGELP